MSTCSWWPRVPSTQRFHKLLDRASYPPAETRVIFAIFRQFPKTREDVIRKRERFQGFTPGLHFAEH
jgi:hypothetical protein